MDYRTLKALLAAAIFLVSPVARADKGTIVFSAAPVANGPTAAEFQPLLSFLSQASGTTIVMAPTMSYLDYMTQMRAGSFDMAFDGPHFVSWRMRHLDHVPLARLPGEVRIVVAVLHDGPRSLDALGKAVNVCSASPPDVLTMAFLRYFPNPIRQPNIVVSPASAEECLRSGAGQAAVLPYEQWKKLDKTTVRPLDVPAHSYPERTFSISKRIAPAVRRRIAKALVSKEGSVAAQALLKQLGADRFEPADAKTYEGVSDLLAPVWGFQ